MTGHEKQALTQLEIKAVMFIHGYLAQHQHPPTTREVGNELHLTGQSAIARLLRSLESKNWIVRLPGRARGLRLWFQVAEGKGDGAKD